MATGSSTFGAMLVTGIASTAGMYLGSITGIGAGRGMVIGAAIGSMIGSYLFPEGPKGQNTSPPGLNENRFQLSSYGLTLPKIWGTKRLAGNIIWMSDIKEVYISKKVKSSSYHMVFGAWGFVIAVFLLDPVLGMMWNPWKQTDTKWYERSRTYTCSFAIAFCEGPVSSIIRMWMDNTIWVDFRNPGGANYPPNSGQSTAQSNYDRSLSNTMGYTLYYGSNTQLPDPTIEAAMGVGNTPAYRGVCYTVIKDFPVGFFSTIPTFEAEIVKTGSTTLATASISAASAKNRSGNMVPSSTPWTIDGNYVFAFNGYTAANVQTGCELIMMNKFSDVVIGRMNVPMPWAPKQIRHTVADTFNEKGTITGWGINPVTGEINICTAMRWGSSYGMYIRREMIYDSFGGNRVFDELKVIDPYYSPVLYWKNFWWTKGKKYAQSFSYANGWKTVGGFMRINEDFSYPGMVTYQQLYGSAYYEGYPVIAQGSGWTGYYMYLQSYNGTWYWIDDYYGGHADSGDMDHVYFCSESNTYPIFSATNEYFTIRVDPGAITWQDGGMRFYVPWGSFERIRMAWEDPYPFAFSNGITFPTTAWHTGSVDPTVTMMEDVTTNVTYKRIWQNKTTAPLSLLVTEVCEAAGIAASKIDVTDLTDEIEGYAITRQMPARTALEPLLPSFIFDVAEVDWKLHFVKRGSASVATILSSELGAVLNGEEFAKNKMIEYRGMDSEIPTHISLNYESINRDYDVTVQRASRIDRRHILPMDISTPVVMTDQAALRQAEIILKALWIARIKYRFSTLMKYLYLAPSRVITVGGKVMRILEMHDRNGVIEFFCESEAVGAYVSTAVTGTLAYSQPNLNNDPVFPTAFLADLPLLQISDLDTPFGFYAGMSGIGSNYSGGVLRTFDITNGEELEFQEIFTAPKDPFGYLMTQLINGVMNSIDYTNTIIVSFPSSSMVLFNFGDTNVYKSDCTAGQTFTAKYNAGSYPISRAFDDNTGTYWSPTDGRGASDSWIQVLFATEKCIRQISLEMYQSYVNYMPTTVTVKASTTGVWAGEEVTLFTQSGIVWVSSEVKKYFQFENANSYRYYRIYGVYPDWEMIQEIEMMELDHTMSPSLNYAAVGSETTGYEIIQYLNRLELGSGVYKLTGICRGLFGTKRFIDAHESADYFIPLNDLALFNRIVLDPIYIDVTLGYMATHPSVAYSVWQREFVAQGNSSKPYPVACIEGSRTETGDLIIDWKREDRLFFTVEEFEEDETDIPMSETTELYEVEICAMDSSEPLKLYQTPSAPLTIPMTDFFDMGFPYRVLTETCDGVLTTNWVDNGWPNGSYQGHAAGMTSGRIYQYSFATYLNSGCNLLAKNLIPSNSYLMFEYQHSPCSEMTAGYFGTNESAVYIVKSNPTYATASYTFRRPEYGVGTNSFIALILSAGPTFTLIQRINGVDTVLGGFRDAHHGMTTSQGIGLMENEKLIVDFRTYRILFFMRGIKQIDVSFDPSIVSYFGSSVQINLHQTNYAGSSYTEYYDNLKISHSQTGVIAPPVVSCNIYQMSSIIGRGHVATATI